MIPKTQEFIHNVTGNLRKCVPKITIPTVYSNLPEFTEYEDGSEQDVISREDQLCNNTVEYTFGFNTLERDRCKVDGVFVVYNNDAIGEFGWIGKELSNQDGSFTNEQWIKLKYSRNFEFDTFYVHFDYTAEEWATDFTIVFYDSNDNPIKTVDIVDNNTVKHTITEYIPLTSYVKLTVRKWSKGGRRCKVSELSEIDVIVFKDDRIKSFELTDQVSILEDQLVTSEFKAVFDNTDSFFDLLNPFGFSVPALSNKQIVNASVSVNNDWVDIAEKFIYKREVTNNECSIYCRDMTEFITTEYIPRSHNTISAYELFEYMFELSGIKRYFIDNRLRDETVNQYTKRMSLRKAMQQLANASGSYIRNGRNGEFIVDLISNVFSNPLAKYSNSTQLDKIKLEQNDKTDSVRVTYFEIQNESEAIPPDEENPVVKEEEVEYFEDSTVILDFKNILINPVIEIIPAVEYTVYADCIELYIKTDGLYNITINGSQLEVIAKSIKIKSEDYDLVENKNDVLIENPFINTSFQAIRLAKNMIEFSKYKNKITLTESGRPDVESGDSVSFETDYGFFDGIVDTQKITYDGSLRGSPVIKSKGSD